MPKCPSSYQGQAIFTFFQSSKTLFSFQHVYMDREAQIEAIEKTFEDVKMPMEEHYSKKGVYPVEVIPILPDSDMWKFPCAQVF